MRFYAKNGIILTRFTCWAFAKVIFERFLGKEMFTNVQQIQRITIWGVGLIGGSLGLALKANGFQGQRIGLGRNSERLKLALQRDAVDSVTTEVTAGIRESDIVVLCTPVALIPMFVERIAEVVDTQQHPIVITDVGSTKATLVKSVETFLDTQDSAGLSFVGGHPMAGSHETGVDAAQSTLFDNAKCILTPTTATDADALQLITNLWAFVGAKTHLLAPDTHDLLIGAASHLPHLIASVLTNSVAGVKTDSGNALDFAATGFRDTTRIAAGPPAMWTDIFEQNASILLTRIDDVMEKLGEFKTLLQNGNSTEIESLLKAAKTWRETLGDS